MIHKLTARQRRRSVCAAFAVMAATAAASPVLAVVKEWNTASGTWSVSGNWLPNGMPTGLDSVFIGNMAAAANGTVTLNVNSTVAQMDITNGMTLDTSGLMMTVGTTTALSGLNATGTGNFASRLRIPGGGAGSFNFRTGNLLVNNGARVDLINGGRLRVDGTLSLGSTSQIGGSGQIDFTGNSPVVFTNNGTLNVGATGLTLRQLGTGRIDLDGGVSDDRTIAVTAATAGGSSFAYLHVIGDQLTDSFDDTLLIGANNSATMDLSNGWAIGSLGTLRFAQNLVFPGAAELNGSMLTMSGNFAFNGPAHGRVNNDVIVTSSAKASLPGGAVLEFNGETFVNGGSFTAAQNAKVIFDGTASVGGGTFNTFSGNIADGGVSFNGETRFNGTIAINGAAEVNSKGIRYVGGNAVINANTFDMDGAFGVTTWDLFDELIVNANRINNVGNTFAGTINLKQNAFAGTGSLAVNLPAGESWRMAGNLNIEFSGLVGANTPLSGSPIILAGNTQVAGDNQFPMHLTFDAGGATMISNGYFRLAGGTLANPNVISGGVITGNGTLASATSRALVGHGTISAAHIALPSSALLLAKGGTLTVNGTGIASVGTIGTADSTGTLNFSSSYNIGAATTMQLNGGRVAGSAIANFGTITGHGTLANHAVYNNKVLSAVGGELVLDASGEVDLDGVVGGVPVVNAVQGDLRIVNSLTDSFDGIATVGHGRKMTFANGWALGPGGTLNLNGSFAQSATVAGGNFQALLGHVNVNFDAEFDILTGFLGGSEISIPNASDRLTLLKGGVINTAANITGNGGLRNAAGSTLVLNTNSFVGVHVLNQGRLAPAGEGTAGLANAVSFTNTQGATFTADIAGPQVALQHDRLNLVSGASIGGTLELNTLSGYVPAYLVSHEIIRANGDGVIGIFDAVTGVQITPTRYWAVTYGPNSVFATAALPGDADLNGSVTLADFNLLAANFGMVGGATWSGGDFTGDGAVTLQDFNALAGHFGLSAGPSGPSLQDWANLASVVPEPAAALWCLSAMPCLLERPRRRTRHMNSRRR